MPAELQRPPAVKPLSDGDFVREIFSVQGWKLAAVLALCAFLVPLCGMLFGFDGSDTHFHLGSWVDAVRDWKSGVYYQGWAAGANYGLGDPRYCFYPPIPMLLGSLALLLLPARLVVGTLFWATFFFSGISMYCLCRRMLSPRRSAVGAVLYTTSYFLLVTAIKHSAIAEQMTDAFLPLLIAYFLEVLDVLDLREWAPGQVDGVTPAQVGADRAYSAWARLAVLFALTWVVDVPVAVASAYTLTIATILVAIRIRSAAPLWRVLAAQAVGVLAAGFYLVPTFLATKTVYAAEKLEFHVRTLFTTHTLQDMTLSADAVLLAAVIGYMMAVSLLAGRSGSREKGPKKLDPQMVILLLGLIAFFFQLSVSRFLWLHLPELRIVGFPHRFQVFLALALPFAVLLKRNGPRLIGAAIGGSVILAAFPFFAMYTWAKRTPIDPAGVLVSKSMQGYEGAPEYVPLHTGAVWVNEKNESVARATPIVQSLGGPGCAVRVQEWNPEERLLQAGGGPGSKCEAVLKLYLHPFWHFTVDGQPVVALADARGLATVTVPPGTHTIEARFHRPMAPVAAGWALTLLAGSLLFVGRSVVQARVRIKGGVLSMAKDARGGDAQVR